MRLSSLTCVAFLLGAALPACGGGGGPPGAPTPRDSGPRRDFGTPDVGSSDVGLSDMGMSDMGDPSDLGSPTDLGLGECTFQPRITLGSEDNTVTQRPAIAASGAVFGVVWRERRSATDDLWIRTIDGALQSADVRLTTDGEGNPVSSLSSSPSIAGVPGGFVAAWLDNRRDGDVTVGTEIWTRSVDTLAELQAAPQRVTDEAGSASDPSIANNGGLVVSWIANTRTTTPPTTTTRVAFARALNMDGSANGTPRQLSETGTLVSGASLIPVTTDFLALWINDDTRSAEYRPVGSDGASAGSIVPVLQGLSIVGGANGIAVRTAGADILARGLSAANALIGSNQSLTGSAATGTDPAAASFSGGTAVAYRRTSGGVVEMVIALVDSNGLLAETIVLGEVTAAGGLPSIAVNSAGELMVAWAEIEAGTTTVVAQRVECE